MKIPWMSLLRGSFSRSKMMQRSTSRKAEPFQPSVFGFFSKNKKLILFFGSGMLVYGFSRFNTVPLSNRTQFLPYPFWVDKLICLAKEGVLNKEIVLADKHPTHVRLSKIITRLTSSDELRPYKKFWFKLYLLDAEVENFFSFPGGAIVAYEKYIASENEFDNDDAVAFFFAHEMAHIIARHQCEMGTRAYASNTLITISLVLSFKKPGPITFSITAVAFILKCIEIKRRYIPKQQKEFEADYIGMLIMSLAGYDPSYAIKIMEHCLRKKSTSKHGSHPPSKERLRRMNEHLPFMLSLSKAARGVGSSTKKSGLQGEVGDKSLVVVQTIFTDDTVDDKKPVPNKNREETADVTVLKSEDKTAAAEESQSLSEEAGGVESGKRKRKQFDTATEN